MTPFADTYDREPHTLKTHRSTLLPPCRERVASELVHLFRAVEEEDDVVRRRRRRDDPHRLEHRSRGDDVVRSARRARERVEMRVHEDRAEAWVGTGGFNVASTCEFNDDMCRGTGPL